MDKLPWFPWYPADWEDTKVLRMSATAQAAYVRILGRMWRDSPDQCSIKSPSSRSGFVQILRILGYRAEVLKRVITELQWRGDPIFVEQGGRWVSKKLQRIKAQQVERTMKMSEGGKKGAEKRWGGHRGGYRDPNRDPNRVSMGRQCQSETEIETDTDGANPPSSPPAGGQDDRSLFGGPLRDMDTCAAITMFRQNKRGDTNQRIGEEMLGSAVARGQVKLPDFIESVKAPGKNGQKDMGLSLKDYLNYHWPWKPPASPADPKTRRPGEPSEEFKANDADVDRWTHKGKGKP